MQVIVTGASCFAGANNVKALNDRASTDVLAVANPARSEKFRNLADCVKWLLAP